MIPSKNVLLQTAQSLYIELGTLENLDGGNFADANGNCEISQDPYPLLTNVTYLYKLEWRLDIVWEARCLDFFLVGRVYKENLYTT